MYWFHIACLDQNLTPNILFHIFLRSFLKQCLFSFSSPHPSYPYINFSNNSWVFPYRISNLFIFLFSLLNIPTPPPPPSYTSVLLPWVFFWPYSMQILIPQPGIEPAHPLQWKRGVLTTGPPGKSLAFLDTVF